jgi:chemotaxis protein CheZ
MAKDAARREFAVERQARLRRQERVLQEIFAKKEDGGPEVTVALDPSGVSNAEILDAITSLAQELLSRPRVEQPIAAQASSVEATAKDVRVEIAQMVRAIGRAKEEIAAIKHPLAPNDPMEAASNELDAIVQATETATNTILDANESIERAIHEIAVTHHEDKLVMAMTDEIAANVIATLEACNFQDLTGQRITKVINTIRFVEDRILAMIAIWGVEAFADLPVEDEMLQDREDMVRIGSKEPNLGISQKDIDALFD